MKVILVKNTKKTLISAVKRSGAKRGRKNTLGDNYRFNFMLPIELKEQMDDLIQQSAMLNKEVKFSYSYILREGGMRYIQEQKALLNRIKTPTTTGNAPAHQVQLGTIRAAIWQNATEAGVRYNVTVERIYKDKDEWKSTGSFGRDDLLLLAKAVDQAHTWIFAQPKPEKPEAK